MLDVDPASTSWLTAYLLLSLLATLAVTAQAALQHASRPRLRLLVDGGLEAAKPALRVLDESSRFPTLLIVLMLLSTGAAGTALVLGSLPLADPPWAPPVAILAGAVLHFVLCAIGRGIGVARPEITAINLTRALMMLRVPMMLVGAPFLFVESKVIGIVGVDRTMDGNAAEEELRLLVETVEDARKLDEDEREMIHGIFEMSQRPVREVMVPRVDVVAVSRDATLGDVVDRIVESGTSRIPVYEGTIDDVSGVVYAKDVLRALRLGKLQDPAGPIARRAYFVPDTKKVDELLQDLQRERVHMAIVVDEYGGTAGLVTIEDLLEEIVGEIRDEYDVNEEAPIRRVDEQVSMVDPRVSIRDVNEALDLHLNDDEFDTLGGLVYHELGKVPTEGDQVRVNGCLVTVTSTQGRRIRKLRVTIVGEDD
jgi:CBS domain containing-hemolysin-like protein